MTNNFSNGKIKSNKDENVHRYAVRGEKKERYRKKFRGNYGILLVMRP